MAKNNLLNRIFNGAEKAGKTILMPLAFAGMIYGTGCKEAQKEIIEKPKELTPLQKYNKANEQVYNDFMNFAINHPKSEMFSEGQYSLKLRNNKGFLSELIDFSADSGQAAYICLKIMGSKTFYDYGKNGLDMENKLLDGVIYRKNGLFKSKYLGDFSSEIQIELAEEYTNTLKDIMHENGLKGY